MSLETNLQIVSDEQGNAIAVIVPIDVWREIESERETAYLLKSEAMRKRLLEAKDRAGGVSLDEARQKLGI
jgi:PHD/YefM family antitoxin component YafN of YafNO toxin-antitoxin module